MPILERADADVREMVLDVMHQYHGELEMHDVRIDLLMATGDKDVLCPLRLHGYPCLAVVKITPYEQRAKGAKDASITFDKWRFEEMSEEKQVALIDHELHHLSIAYDKNGRVKLDTLGRPKLKMRLHDVQFGWFTRIAERHGEASVERMQARVLAEEYGQLLFPWAADAIMPPAVAVAAAAPDADEVETDDQGEVLPIAPTAVVTTSSAALPKARKPRADADQPPRAASPPA